MTRKALTQAEIDNFRQAYCEKAYELFKENDFHAISMRGIAKEMGCSPMAAYRYFENKEAVFSSLRAILFHRLADTLESVPNDGNALVYLKKLGFAYANFALENPSAYRLLYLIQIHQEQTSAEVEVAQTRTKNVLFNATQQAIKAGELSGDVVTVAHGLWGLIHGIVSLDLANQLNQGANFDQLMPDIFEQFLKRMS